MGLVAWVRAGLRLVLLRPRGLLVVDNAVSHAHEMESFLQAVEDAGFTCSLVPVGKGEFLATRAEPA